MNSIDNDLNALEENIEKTKHNKKQNKLDLKFKIVDVEKEKDKIKNNLDDIEKELNSQVINRKDILNEVNKNIDNYSNKLLDYENRIKTYELKEIEYKNQARELEDYIEMYSTIKEEHIEETDKLNREIINLRKKIKANETLLSTFRSMVTLFINDYGIDKVSEITGIEQDNIEKYLQD